jgi:hypothetical protein
MPRLGVIGALVWDEIHGRDPRSAPVEEWGGIAYALEALDAALPPDWEVVPLIKVGRDMAPAAAEFLRTLQRVAPSARCVEVPAANNRVVLRYESDSRRCEQLSGGVPGWNWPELGPLIGDLDALYVNFISGFEMDLATAESLRTGFGGPIYADLHSLFLGVGADGMRMLRGAVERGRTRHARRRPAGGGRRCHRRRRLAAQRDRRRARRDLRRPAGIQPDGRPEPRR